MVKKNAWIWVVAMTSFVFLFLLMACVSLSPNNFDKLMASKAPEDLERKEASLVAYVFLKTAKGQELPENVIGGLLVAGFKSKVELSGLSFKDFRTSNEELKLICQRHSNADLEKIRNGLKKLKADFHLYSAMVYVLSIIEIESNLPEDDHQTREECIKVNEILLSILSEHSSSSIMGGCLGRRRRNIIQSSEISNGSAIPLIL